MKIAVLSGKGGTGKTTVAVNLAYVSEEYRLIDADVEEPNSYLFLNPQIKNEKSVFTMFPVVNAEKCILCGKCGEFCRFNAIIPAKNTILVFKESCHDCGGCEIVCKAGAISYDKREIGKIYEGIGKDYNLITYGELNIGELSGVKIIKELKKEIRNGENVLIDSPPGAACAVAAAIDNIDYAILVTEPTPFGLSDMKIVIELLRSENIDFGVIVNKAGLGNDETYKYCEKEGIEIIGDIPFNLEIAKIYSEGKIIAEYPKYEKMFSDILGRISGKEQINDRN